MEQVLVAFVVLSLFVVSAILGFRTAVAQVSDHCEGDALVVTGVVIGFMPAFLAYSIAFLAAILDPSQGANWLLGGMLAAWGLQVVSMSIWGIVLDALEGLGLVHSPLHRDLLQGADKHKVRWYGRR